VWLPGQPEVMTQVRLDTPDASVVATRFGQAQRCFELVTHALGFPKGVPQLSEIETDIDGLGNGLRAFTEVAEGAERLLQTDYGLAICRAFHRGCTGLAEGDDGLFPQLALAVVHPDGELMNPEVIGVQRFECLTHLAMEKPTLWKQEVRVGNGANTLVGEVEPLACPL